MALRVLVVDDCRDTVDTTILLLRQWGYEGTAAYDGGAAVNLAQQRGADMALLDVAVPHVEDGYALAGQLRADVPLLVAVTGFADGEHRRRCEEAGFDLVFAKPLDHEQLPALLADAARLIADAGQSGGQPQVWDEQARQGWTALRARWRYQQELTAGPGGAGDG